MTNVFSLDTAREEADRKFGAPFPVEIDKDTTVHLRSVLRLNKSDREKVQKAVEVIQSVNEKNESDQESVTEKDVDRFNAAIFEVLTLVAGKDSKALLDALDGDYAVATLVLNAYMEASQMGGSLQLGRLIDEYGDAVLADLRSEYGISLKDIFTDSLLGPIELLVLIKELPRDGRYWSEIQGGPQFRGWDDKAWATAALVNEIRAFRFYYLLAQTPKKKRGGMKPPEPLPVPEVKKRTKQYKPGSFGHIAAMRMAASRNRKAPSTGG
ncbi:tail assembly chaperone [Mycobacterium phage Pepe]|uniref:tail assembly chaperone n=1 Tax=Mycobacterium phage Pepe TaxID=1735466 RepID=UPI000706269B|nr:tail assembly chaperone [Mycobacterium phage Pepe]ALK86998.1 tail assembly chaperone [Mycobacterium phage Pepe]